MDLIQQKLIYKENKMNWLEKIRDNFIPIERLYNKNFYTDKVASLLLRLPLNEVNQEVALVLFLSKGYSKHKLLKLYQKQNRIIAKINKQMDKFKVYDARIKRYVQTLVVKYGKGIEYLILGEILEKDFKINFPYSPQEVYEDKGYALCAQIEVALNRIGAYFIEKDVRVLKSIRQLIKDNIVQEKLLKADD